MENKREEAQAHSHSRICVTVLYPRNIIKKGGRRTIALWIRALIHSHTSSLLHHHRCHRCYRHRHRHCISFMRFRRSPQCGYENDYIVYSPDYVIPIAQNGKKSLTHEWMAETSGWDSERKEHQFISLELPSIFFSSLVSITSRTRYCVHAYIHILINIDRFTSISTNSD